MNILMVFAVAVRALRRNAMRTSLTALGMIIGVGAVIVMVAIGNGARASIESQIRSAGSNLVIVSAGSTGFGPVRQGQGATTHTHRSPTPRPSATRCRASATCRPA